MPQTLDNQNPVNSAKKVLSFTLILPGLYAEMNNWLSKFCLSKVVGQQPS